MQFAICLYEKLAERKGQSRRRRITGIGLPSAHELAAEGVRLFVAIQRFLTGLLAKVPDFRFENVRIWIETPERVFGEYDAQDTSCRRANFTSRPARVSSSRSTERSRWCTKRSTPLRHRAHSTPTESDAGPCAAQSRLANKRHSGNPAPGQ